MSQTTPPPKPPAQSIPATQPISPGGGGGAAPATPFQSYMQPSGAPGAAGAAGTNSPFALAQGQILTATPTFNTLLGQVSNAQGMLGGIQNQMNTPNLKLKASQKYLLKNKLTDANEHLRTANAKLGGDPIEETEVPPGGGPIARFLAYITDGQNQLEEAKKQVGALKDKGQDMSPADLLLIQIKLNKAQQEIEYSSVLLSKAIDDMKTLMNIQL